jgi:hypothetical protein
LWKGRGPETEEPLQPLLQLDGIKMVYLHGRRQMELISPDNWSMDLEILPTNPARPETVLDFPGQPSRL